MYSLASTAAEDDAVTQQRITKGADLRRALKDYHDEHQLRHGTAPTDKDLTDRATALADEMDIDTKINKQWLARWRQFYPSSAPKQVVSQFLHGGFRWLLATLHGHLKLCHRDKSSYCTCGGSTRSMLCTSWRDSSFPYPLMHATCVRQSSPPAPLQPRASVRSGASSHQAGKSVASALVTVWRSAICMGDAPYIMYWCLLSCDEAVDSE
jgi:hypothetical protein